MKGRRADDLTQKGGRTPPPIPAHDGMRRLQIGIAGVLTVLLLVGMAGLVGDRARERAALEADATAEAGGQGGAQKSASAPLEELGVQPMSKEQTPTPAPAAKAPPPGATVPDLEPDPELERARQSKR